jgi:hypothetical protein
MKKELLIANELLKRKIKFAKHEDVVIDEVYKILNKDLFHEKKVLSNLQLYNRSFEMINEDDVDILDVFDEKSIKEIAIKYRLRFIDSQFYKKEIPYEAVLKVKDLNAKYRKDLKGFKILAPIESFRAKGKDRELLLFAPTSDGNYFLVHKWGEALDKNRKVLFWPLRRFENLLLTVITITAIITLILPPNLMLMRMFSVTEDVGYWNMNRLAAYFHILIFNMGFTAYLTFTFTNNFSTTSWNTSYDNR